jgi:dephospho-CoA kinase
MKEIIFVVEESEEGGLIAKALGVSIFTEAESLEELRTLVKEAVKCHFDDDIQRVVRLHIVKEEVFAA